VRLRVETWRYFVQPPFLVACGCQSIRFHRRWLSLGPKKHILFQTKFLVFLFGSFCNETAYLERLQIVKKRHEFGSLGGRWPAARIFEEKRFETKERPLMNFLIGKTSGRQTDQQ